MHNFDDEYPVVIIPRTEWSAREPKTTVPVRHPVSKLIYSYDLKIEICKTKDECLQAMSELQRRHMDEENCDDIKYNFLFGGDGRIYEGRGWNAKPCKSLKFPAYYNKRLDFGFIGNYFGMEMVHPLTMAKSFELIRYGARKGLISDRRNIYEIVGPPTYGNVLYRNYQT